MKKSILLSLALLASIGLSAAPTTEGDTVVVEKPQRVTVVTTDSIQHILVEGKEDNPHYTYSNTLQIVDSNYVSGSSINKDDFTIGFGWPKLARKNTDHQSTYELTAHFCIGFVNAPGMPKAGDLNMGNSAELWFFFENEWRPWRNNHVFSFGIGLDWRNYRMEDNYCFRKDAEGMNVLERLPEGASPNFSRVKVFSLNFPIRYQYQGRRFGFSLGPVLNFNTYSSIKTKYNARWPQIQGEVQERTPHARHRRLHGNGLHADHRLLRQVQSVQRSQVRLRTQVQDPLHRLHVLSRRQGDGQWSWKQFIAFKAYHRA